MSAQDGVVALRSAEVSVKLFVDDHSVVRPLELIPVFHRWIKEGALEDELMIDVANYEHVPKGPGIVLICDKAHYYFDVRENHWGIRYRGRRDARATGQAAIAHAFASALKAASLLENDPELEGRYHFRTDRVEFGIYDRLRAPSDQATFDAVKPALEAAVAELYGAAAESLELVSGPQEPFMVAIETGAAPSIEELLDRALAPTG
ncbi:MAG: hypothetical protein PVJ80_10895 [Gemmatimonadota bacterium]|jgi:hypothetical protein